MRLVEGNAETELEREWVRTLLHGYEHGLEPVYVCTYVQHTYKTSLKADKEVGG